MSLPPRWISFAFLGCLTLVRCAAAQDAATAQARQLWLQGQEAMRRGQASEAVQLYEQSLDAAHERQRRHLSLAATDIQSGNEASAASHLAQYLAAFPDHHVVRIHYAELLTRMHRLDAARRQFERCVADVQDDADLAAKHLVHCHSRLMEIATSEGDEYAEHLHCGIGLYLLARGRTGPEEGEFSAEGLLCKAAGELTMARLARRDEARPCWYLYAVWSRLDQRQPALRHLREAEALAPFSDLAPAERRDLAVACLGRDAGLRRPR
jgi:tetratricopeptide (TPR) repeat protein